MTEKDDKFILMNLDDKRSKKIAEVMGNETCKKIIDYLTDNSEKSEEDIAKALGMKINTVEYNLKKLIQSGLVEKTKNFFWSKRGKKISLYKLAQKHIVISPKRTRPNFSALKTILPVIIAAAFLLVLIAFFPKGSDIGQTSDGDNGIQHFSSMEELNAFLEENQGVDLYGGIATSDLGRAEIATDSAVSAGAPINDFAATPQAKESTGASDYSETNVQVEGVDEADIVKNDGKYIYIAQNGNLTIIKAYPAESMEIVSEIEIEGLNNIYINGDTLITFSYSYKDGQKSIVRLYDVSDRTAPELIEEYSVDGYYVDSRMIGDYVYLIANKYVRIGNVGLPVLYRDGVAETTAVEDIGYFPQADSSYTFTNILAIDVDTQDYNMETFLLGSGHNIYVSENNIYLTVQKQMPMKDYFEDLVSDAILPILPKSVAGEVKDVLESDDKFYEKQDEIGRIIEEYSSSLRGDEKSDFDGELQKKVEEFTVEMAKQMEKTFIHKLSIDKTNVKYLGYGSVPGRTLNQFSMDENDGYFRIATTTGNAGGSSSSSLNHMYVLDEDLEIVGSVEDLAKGERVYSVRFMGDKAYMVTFRQVDPLFVVDLSDPQDPKVLGELKVTGYSSYIHPIDENHIIGIGMEATEQGRTTGVKIAVFDVTNPENPIENAKYEVGGRWSSSNALYDHKAFLYDKERQLLVLPMSYNEDTEEDYRYSYWQGAFVFKLTTNEIALRGKIDHQKDSEKELHYYGPYAIQRSLYMGDTLYTISRAYVKANDLHNLKEINEVEYYDEPDYPVFRTAEPIAAEDVMID